MAKDSSFDIVSEPDWGEIANAVHQAQQEAGQRFDFRGHDVEIRWDRKAALITVEAPAGLVLEAAVALVEQRLARRGVPLRFLAPGDPEPRGGDRAQVVLTVRHGIPPDVAKRIQQAVRALKLKVDVAIQGDALRVSGKQKDDLQAVIRHLKSQDFGVELAFTNYR
ncbi:MAG: YajQ family cyclic di-GMP-binding protein [Actinomycetia bacterium]|nr:YajQ family cyclic di-GMP-binding protein [Actinomycetes bacterium]